MMKYAFPALALLACLSSTAYARLTVGIVPPANNLLTNRTQANQFAAYLQQRLGEEVKIRRFDSEKQLHTWLNRFREVDLAVLSQDYIQRQPAGEFYLLKGETVGSGTLQRPADLIVGRQGLDPRVRRQLREILSHLRLGPQPAPVEVASPKPKNLSRPPAANPAPSAPTTAAKMPGTDKQVTAPSVPAPESTPVASQAAATPAPKQAAPQPPVAQASKQVAQQTVASPAPEPAAPQSTATGQANPQQPPAAQITAPSPSKENTKGPGTAETGVVSPDSQGNTLYGRSAPTAPQEGKMGAPLSQPEHQPRSWNGLLPLGTFVGGIAVAGLGFAAWRRRERHLMGQENPPPLLLPHGQAETIAQTSLAPLQHLETQPLPQMQNPKRQGVQRPVQRPLYRQSSPSSQPESAPAERPRCASEIKGAAPRPRPRTVETAPPVNGTSPQALLHAAPQSGTTADSDRRTPRSSSLDIQGVLGSAQVPALLKLLGAQPKPGTLIIQSRHDEKRIHIRRGKIVSAQSVHRLKRSESGFLMNKLGYLLVRQGKITEEIRDRALEYCQQHPAERLGQALIKLNELSAADLKDTLRQQAKGVIFSLILFPRGRFRFVPETLDLSDEDNLDMDIGTLLQEASRQTAEWSDIRRAIPSLDTVLDYEEEGRLKLEKATMTLHQKLVMSLVDGRRTIKEICVAATMLDFEVYKFLYIMVKANILLRVQTEGCSPSASPLAGNL